MTLIRKAQSVTEYAILLGLAIAAFAGMQIYVKRSLNARIKKGADAATGAGVGTSISADGADTGSVEFGKGTQYEPYYVDSQAKTYSEDVSREQLKEGKLKKEIVSNVQATAGDGYSAEKTYKNNAGSANVQWDTATEEEKLLDAESRS